MADKLYSLSGLKAFGDNDPAFISQIIKMSSMQMIELSNLIQSFSRKKEWQEVFFYAHKLKASIILFEIVSLNEEIRELEKNAKAGINIEQIYNQIKYIVSVIEECVSQMERDFL